MSSSGLTLKDPVPPQEPLVWQPGVVRVALRMLQGVEDAMPTQVDAIFFHSRARREDQTSSTKVGLPKFLAILQSETGAPIVLPGYYGEQRNQGKGGYRGPEFWRGLLLACNVPADKIVVMPGEGNNTQTEFIDFMEWAVAHDVKTVVPVNTLIHTHRSSLTSIRSLQRAGLENTIRIFPRHPPEIVWGQEVYGSQGADPRSYRHWLKGEYERIETYYNKGDLVLPQELIGYLTELGVKPKDFSSGYGELWKYLCEDFGWSSAQAPAA